MRVARELCLSYQVTPHVSVAVLRRTCEPAAAIAVRAVDVPDAVARAAVELVRRAFEADERRARAVDLVTLLEARQERIVRRADGGQEWITRRAARRLRDQRGEHLLRPACLARGSEPRRTGARGRGGEARRIRGARLRAARERDAAEPGTVLALAVVAPDERRVPVAPAGERRQHCGEVGEVREHWCGDVDGHVAGIVAEGAGGGSGEGYGVGYAWAVR